MQSLRNIPRIIMMMTWKNWVRHMALSAALPAGALSSAFIHHRLTGGDVLLNVGITLMIAVTGFFMQGVNLASAERHQQR